MSNKDFYQTFPKVNKAAWIAQIESEIKKRDLSSFNIEVDKDWQVSPFKHVEDINFVSDIGKHSDLLKWKILERFGISDEDRKTILQALEGGCESLQFSLDFAQDLRLRNLLQDVLPELISFHFESNKLPVLAEFHPQFTKWISDEGCDLSKINGSIRIQNPHKNDVSPEVLLEYSRNIETSLPNMKTICWNLLWSKDEEGLTQSMCTFFSDIIHYLSKIQSQESIQKLLKKSILKVEITSNYIFEIIRLRAIRLLWNNLLLANEINQGPISLEVHFSPQSYFEEPDKNMIVASTMALSAIVGGADSVYILPSDANPESHDKHKRRIARNIHHIFRFECYLEKHLDPVKGAYFFESTVQQLVERVWERCLQ